MNKTQVK